MTLSPSHGELSLTRRRAAVKLCAGADLYHQNSSIMAHPVFDAVRPSRSAAGGSSRVQRMGALATLLVASVVALSLTFGHSSEEPSSETFQPQAQLFEEPSISLGIREHESLDHQAPARAPVQKAGSAGADQEQKAAGSKSAKPVQSLSSSDAQKTSLGDYVDISHPSEDRYNYQMDSTLTWPPHDTANIPTGAYAKTYKGPYDPDYDWPDDTQVVRNDEWDKSGGVGCGMYGNSC